MEILNHIIEILQPLFLIFICYLGTKAEKHFKRMREERSKTEALDRINIRGQTTSTMLSILGRTVKAVVADLMDDADACRDPSTHKISSKDAERLRTMACRMVHDMLPFYLKDNFQYESGHVSPGLMYDYLGGASTVDATIKQMIEQSCIELKIRYVDNDKIPKIG